MPSSIDLQPNRQAFLLRFLASQFLVRPVPPPTDVTLAGKTAVITGSNVGLGLECAKQLLGLGLSHLILAVRSEAKGEAAAKPLREAHPKARVEVWLLDMSSYESVQGFAKRCATLPRLDYAVLNAALGAFEFRVNPVTKYEESFQVNYLSTALLSILLLPTLRRSTKANHSDPTSRLSIISSDLGLTGPFPEREANPIIPAFGEKKYFSQDRYGTTKTLTHILTYKLGQLVDADDVIVNAPNPGLTGGTDLLRQANPILGAVSKVVKYFVARSIQQGTWTYVDALLRHGKDAHGSFLSDWKIYPFHPMLYDAQGKAIADRLWQETLEEFEFADARGVMLDVGGKKTS